MTMKRRARSGYSAAGLACGFTLLELIAVIAIIVLLMGLYLQRMPFYQEQAEKAAMESVAASIQSGLTLQFGMLLTRGQPSDVAVLTQENPVNWLQKPPRNYAGEYFDPTPSSAEPGSWVFDLKSRELIYLPRITSHFKPGRDGRKWIRFHVVISHEKSRLPSLQQAPAELTGALFEPVEPYAWF